MSATPITSASQARTSGAIYRPSAHSTRLWVWWHLLSLDAPTVAVVWCYFFATTFQISLPWTSLLTLALGTWCVYVADRLLDGWRSTDSTTLRERHWFYLRHRKAFVITWIAAAIPVGYLVLFRVSAAVRIDDMALLLIGMGYFILIHNHAAQRRLRFLFSKEFSVGLLFSVATAVPTWTRLQRERDLLLFATLTFGAICWLNCVAIQVWEDAEVRRAGITPYFFEIRSGADAQATRPHHLPLTDFLGNHLTAFATAIGVAALLLFWMPAARTTWPLFAAVSASSLLFLALIRHRERFSALSLRILADGALLTPFLCLLRVR